MNSIKIIGVLLIGFTLTACDTFHEYDQVIQNNSTQSVTFALYGQDTASLGHTIVVAPGERKTIYQFSKLGKVPEGLSCIPTLDSMVGNSADGRKLSLDFLRSSNWVSSVTGKGVTVQTCTFIIEDADLE